jgi:hypothetical protein
MAELHFKKGLYKYYAPLLFRLYKLKASINLWRWNKNQIHLAQLSQVYWNRFLGRKFVGEVKRRGGRPYVGEDLVGDTQGNAFILGCGNSINDITAPEWEIISQGFSVGLNTFFVHDFQANAYFSEFCDVDEYYELIYSCLLDNPARKDAQAYLSAKYVLLKGSKYRKPSVQDPLWYIANSVKLLDEGLLRRFVAPYFDSKANMKGFSHHVSNTDTAINFCVRKGYKKIYLVGMDLSNDGYFWDHVDTETYRLARRFIANLNTVRDSIPDKQGTHLIASKSIAQVRGNFTIIEYLQILQRTILAPMGVQLYVCNPASLLVKVLPYVPIQEVANVS